MRKKPTRLARFCLIIGLGVALVLTGCMIDTACTQKGLDTRPQPPEVVSRECELIAPGTVIDDRAPPPWTHLINKSHPRPTTGDLDRLDETSKRLSMMLFTTMMAQVEKERGRDGKERYRLQRVGVGLGTRIGDRDTVLSPDTQRQFGADLGFLARRVLSEAYERQQAVRLVASSPVSAIVDTPATMVREGRHRPVIIRYALLIDEQSGDLETLAWAIDLDREGNHAGTLPSIEWLARNKIIDTTMNVDRREFTLGIPSERAFAIHRIPQGHTRFTMSNEFRQLAGDQYLTQSSAERMETLLRGLIARVHEKRPG